MNSRIKKILVSEKSFQAAGNGKYSFIVDKDLEKNAIAKACEKLFGVNVVSVNTMNYKGKIKSVKRVTGKRSDFKKAVLSLKPGQKIDLFEIEKEAGKEKSAKASKENKKEKKAPENKASTLRSESRSENVGNVEVKIKSK